MALNHPDADNYEVQGVVSVRSSMPVGDPLCVLLRDQGQSDQR